MRVLLIFIFLLTGTARAQKCDEKIESDNSIYGYRNRTGDERCEGTYKRYRSGEILTLVSFTEENISYQLNDKSFLEITVPETKFHKNINVQGVNIGMNSNISYRLDITVSEKNSSKIPLKDVIIPLDIRSANLGIYGYLINQEEKFFVPVKAKTYDKYNPNKKSLIPSPYKIKFVCSTNLASLSWVVIKAPNKIPFLTQEFNKLSAPINRDQPTEIDLSPVIKQLGGNEFTLFVKVLNKNGSAHISSYNLYIP